MLTLATLSLACALVAPPESTNAADSLHQRLYESGVSFQAFLDKARQRKDQWRKNYESTVVPDALADRARSAGGPWRFLVVAVDGCSDSVNTIPYLARLVELIPGADLRIVDTNAGRAVMEAHRTPDGRAATPTVVLLDGAFAERGCFVERPPELQGWIIDNKDKLDGNEIFSRKMKWYDDDKGTKTLEEIVAVLEAAKSGQVRCK